MKTLSQLEARAPISSLPFTIAAPGSYYLTGDLTGVAGQSGITITASFVTLDLNGFSLVGVPGSLDGINATVASTRNLEIRNGVIRGWAANGISASLATYVHAKDLRLDTNGQWGMFVGARSIVRDTTSTANLGNGIEVGLGGTIIGCTAGSNNLAGIVAGTNSLVSSSTASSNGGVGIQLTGASTATDCNAQQNVGGFNVGAGSRVLRSVARQNVVGISATSEGSSIEECTVELNTDDGIQAGTRGLVRGNLVRGNTNDGIQVFGSENRIEDNESMANGTGIRVQGSNNVVVKNSVGSNTTEYSIGPGNKAGAISADPMTAGPWANFDQ